MSQLKTWPVGYQADREQRFFACQFFPQWCIFVPLWLVQGMEAKKGRMMIEGGTVLFPMRTEILCSNWGWQDRLTALPNPYPHSNCRMGCLSASYLFHIAVKGKQIHCSKYHASRWEAKTCCLAGIFALFFCFGKGLIPWDSGGWVTAVQALNSFVFYCQNWIKCRILPNVHQQSLKGCYVSFKNNNNKKPCKNNHC